MIVVLGLLTRGQASGDKMSGILEYFKQTNKVLITPEVKKNEDVAKAQATAGMKRGHYDFWSDNNKAKVAKYAFDHDVTESLQHF